ncbi:thaumatin family protein [Nannocystaceae bacterium ST9]
MSKATISTRVFPIALVLACTSEPSKPKPEPAAKVEPPAPSAKPASEPARPPVEAVTPPAPAPTITFTNSCTQSLWLAEFGNGASGACTTNADCNGGTCTNGACEQIPCTKAGDCTDLQFCDAASCSSGAQCPAKACTTNADCTIPGQTCDTTSGVCSPTCSGTQCMCASDSDCPAEGQCIDNLCTGGLCRYALTPSPGFWQVAAGATQTITMPVGWGGRFWARTGCPDDFATCKPGFASCTQNSDCCNDNCSGQTGAMFCTPGVPACTTGDCQAGAACDVSAGAPVALFEVNFATASTTWFDVSLVDGINVPLAVAALDAGGKPLTSCTPANVGGCNAALDGSTLAPLLVASTTACTQDSDCPFLADCVSGFCATGYGAACDACNAGSTNAALDCATNQNLYCCTGPNAASCNLGNPTCMNDGDCPNGGTCNDRNVCTPITASCTADSDCAADYVCDPDLKACLPGTALASTCCGPFNPSWRAAAQPWALPYKAACPNAYAYQFDDPSSNTVCPTTASFQVTFCPS